MTYHHYPAATTSPGPATATGQNFSQGAGTCLAMLAGATWAPTKSQQPMSTVASLTSSTRLTLDPKPKAILSATGTLATDQSVMDWATVLASLVAVTGAWHLMATTFWATAPIPTTTVRRRSEAAVPMGSWAI